ncbi:ABC1 kinase family protein [Roseateles toxinivorans]|uniref:ABC1 family protein n=1 Tax=Roseateles toxinivorans TaxID=270368 RepID=A0A4R6QKT5_9BURK|nr:AarF/ABC1/UbiB kinase family protein [Roseateles toxinivorans]TDP63947.1 ABC1 family protein [Roseateles toxinivorans]
MSGKAPHSGRLARGAIAGTAAVKLGMAALARKAQVLTQSDDAGTQARAAHEAKLGRILFGALNQLKGTALKASQLLSLELGLLPEGMRRELARAHYQVTPLNRALVIKLLRQEFGAGPEDLFAGFEPQAFAAASLGQVHGATLHSGEAVAVKLQYPGMAASIGSDMALLRGLLQGLALGSASLPKPEVLARMMADIELKLAEELDYRQEAEQLRWFGRHLASMPDLVVPRPVAERSSQRVLTMTRLPGLHLNEWLASGPCQAERDRYGQLLFDLLLHCVFVLGRLQADPHPGNSLFMSKGRLGLLDFGCTQTLSPAFCAGLSAAWNALLRQPCDHQALQQAYLALGLISPELGADRFRDELLPALNPFLAWQVQPFTQAVFDFGQHPPPPRTHADRQRTALTHLQSMAPEMPYFDRSYLGLLQTLRALGARVRTTNRWIHA